jgi:UDP-N-acetylmuramoyl-L-alanyl-D-glutamate--2,6-diaminopimelate ligase
VVDYAQIPDSLDNVLRLSRPLTEGRLRVVFGGGRDRGKRPLTGGIATPVADRVMVTSDTLGLEDLDAIISEILEGSGRDVIHDADRRAAIATATEDAAPGDVVVGACKCTSTDKSSRADGRSRSTL